jgi:type VI secretion system protein ImpM
MNMQLVSGWYGKFPALGDFASRRLDPSFIDAWDQWLQSSLVGSQRMLGAHWQEHYLVAPIWHFLIGPGVIGEAARIGLLMPSVDRVGRAFPLTVCAALPFPIPGLSASQAQQLMIWQEAIEDLMRRVLTEGLSLQQFEDQLETVQCELDGESAMTEPAQVTEGEATLTRTNELASLLSQQPHWQDRSIWWLPPQTNCASTRIHSGLPGAADFTRMLCEG